MAYITLSRSAFFHNLELLSQKAGGKEKLFIVLKDNAYGHGLVQMAKLSAEFGLECAVVRNYEEAEPICNLFKNVIILNPLPSKQIPKNFSLVISDQSMLDKLKRNSRIHLKIDTGMHRNGIDPDEIETSIAKIKKNSLYLDGVLTHFRSADEIGSELFWQQKIWQDVKERVIKTVQDHALAKPLFHSANSAALLRLNDIHGDSARCGIAAYGYHQLHDSFGDFDLKPVLKLYASKVNTKILKKGQRVGYGGLFCARKRMTVSTYDIGYGDGLLRYNAKGDFFMANRKILGKISMDYLCVEGDEQEILILNDAKKTAKYFDTISYDILVKLSPNIKRVVTD